jgi:transcriptional regulator with XRE-family HTH domain
MNKPIDGQILKKLRTSYKMTQDELARAANIAKDTVSRLERGEQPGTGRSGKALAKALGVDLAVLTGEAKMSAPDDDTWLDRFTYPLDVRVEGDVQNAYELTALRYRISVEQIVKVAPLLFVLAAERSLARRKRLLAELEAAVGQADDIASKFPHLPTTFLPSHAVNEAMGAEEESIAALDILADRLEDDGIWTFSEHKDAYDQSNDNPFVQALREEAKLAGVAEITSFSSFDVDFRVCEAEAKRIALGDTTLADDILSGATRLKEMPEALWASDAIEDRLAWLRQKSAERQANSRKLLEELGAFDVPTTEPATEDGAAP